MQSNFYYPWFLAKPEDFDGENVVFHVETAGRSRARTAFCREALSRLFCGSERISQGRLEQSSLGNRSAGAGHALRTDITGVSGAQPLMFTLSRATYPTMCSRCSQRACACFQFDQVNTFPHRCAHGHTGSRPRSTAPVLSGPQTAALETTAVARSAPAACSVALGFTEECKAFIWKSQSYASPIKQLCALH